MEEYFGKNPTEEKLDKEGFKDIGKEFIDYQLFPDRKLQEKIDKFLSPYNNQNNLQRSMNFENINNEENNNFEKIQNENIKNDHKSRNSPQTQSWKKISNFIFNEKIDFRNSLRVLNKKRYVEYEKAFHTMMNLKPEWSVFKHQI